MSTTLERGRSHDSGRQRGHSRLRALECRTRRGRPGSEQQEFRRDVEGLRAVAILLVVLYHVRVPGTSGGYVGVDVFFVIETAVSCPTHPSASPGPIRASSARPTRLGELAWVSRRPCNEDFILGKGTRELCHDLRSTRMS